MFDALDMARQELDKFAALYPSCRKRILCLSDGADNKSVLAAHTVATALQRSGVVCDSICIGEARRNGALKVKRALHLIACSHSLSHLNL